MRKSVVVQSYACGDYVTYVLAIHHTRILKDSQYSMLVLLAPFPKVLAHHTREETVKKVESHLHDYIVAAFKTKCDFKDVLRRAVASASKHNHIIDARIVDDYVEGANTYGDETPVLVSRMIQTYAKLVREQFGEEEMRERVTSVFEQLDMLPVNSRDKNVFVIDFVGKVTRFKEEREQAAKRLDRKFVPATNVNLFDGMSAVSSSPIALVGSQRTVSAVQDIVSSKKG